MPSPKDAILGKLAIDRGYLTQEQVDEAFDIQRRMLDELGMDQPLEQVLTGKKWLTPDQTHELRNAVAVQTGEARLVAGYEVISKLGKGGMGVVYKARRVGTDEVVALKVLPPSLADKEMIARFKRESKIVRRLDHENIVACVEFGFDKRRRVHFCALEFVEGEDLAKHITRLGRIGEDEAISIVSQIAMALQHAFFNGLVHRDVKPENIMVTADGTAKLLDLGLARPASMEATRMTQSGMFVGSPYYASPEQAMGEKEVDTHSDIYSLGATLYHMVTGKPPFEGTTALAILQKHVNEKLPWPAEVNPELSDGFCKIIAKMMEKEPEHRYQTPNDLNSDLDLLMAGQEPEIEDAAIANSSVKVPAVRPGRRRRLPGRSPGQLAATVPGHGRARERAARERERVGPRRAPSRGRDSAREQRRGAGHEEPQEPSGRSALQVAAKIAILAGAGVLVVVAALLLVARGKRGRRRPRPPRSEAGGDTLWVEQGKPMRDAAPAEADRPTVDDRKASPPSRPAASPLAEAAAPLADPGEPNKGGVTATPGKITVAAASGLPPDARQASTTARGSGRPPQGIILREWWMPRLGEAPAVLSKNRPTRPTGSEYVTSFEGPKDPNDDYNSRLRGYIHPPVNGEYVFRLSSDNQSQLWLSTDDDPARMVKIAGIGQSKGYEDWTTASGPVTLRSGRKYYVEAVHKEDHAGDHIRVGWDRPDGASDRPIPGTYLSPWYGVPRAPKIVGKAPEIAWVGTPYAYTVRAAGDPAATVAVKGFPDWLDFDGKGTVSGTPGGPHLGTTRKITVTATNRLGADRQEFRITVRKLGLDRGLVGWWEFDESEGTTARDSSGQGNHGALRGSPGWLPTGGRIGGALHFDGLENVVSLRPSRSFIYESGVSVCAWVRCEGKWGCVICQNGGGKYLNLHVSATDRMRWEVGQGQAIYLRSQLGKARWRHIVGTYEVATSCARLFIDGDLTSEESLNGSVDYRKVSSFVGAVKQGSGALFKGSLDDVRIYNRALSAEEVAVLFGEPERIAAAQARAEAERRKAERLASVLAQFDSLLEKRDYAGIKRLMERAVAEGAVENAEVVLATMRLADLLAARDRAIRSAAARLSGATAELRTARGKILGKVEEVTDEAIVLAIRRGSRGTGAMETRMKVKWDDLAPEEEDRLARKGGWKAAGPAAAVARAILALDRRDVQAARAALAGASDHPLAAHLRGKMASRGPRVDDEPAGPRKPAESEKPAPPVGPARPVKRKPANYARFVALRELKGHADAVISARFSPDGSTVLTASKDQTARTWDSHTGKALHVMKGYAYGCQPAVFSPDGRLIMTAPDNVWAQLWNASTGGKAVRSPSHGAGVHAHHARFNTSGSLVASAGNENVLVWETSTGQLRHRLIGHMKTVQALAFSADERKVLTVASDNTARIWDEAGNSLHVLDIGGRPGAAAFSPDGRLAVTSSPVRIWDAKTGASLAKFEGHAFVEFSPDGKLFLTITGNEVHVWDTRRGRVFHKLRGHSAKISSAAFSRDGRWVVTSSEDRTARVWQVASGLAARKLVGHDSAVLDASFSPDGRMVATASQGRSARIWGELQAR